MTALLVAGFGALTTFSTFGYLPIGFVVCAGGWVLTAGLAWPHSLAPDLHPAPWPRPLPGWPPGLTHADDPVP